MNIREIEKIIDNNHRGLPIFKLNREQALYSVLSVFEDICWTGSLTSVLFDPSVTERNIHDMLDAVNQAVIWIFDLCSEGGAIIESVDELSYKQASELLIDYASPYSKLVDGFIAFSRNYMNCEVSDSNVIFSNIDNPAYIRSYVADIVRETRQKEQAINLLADVPSPDQNVLLDFFQTVHIEDDCICYEPSQRMYDYFKGIAQRHWEGSSALPKHWKFDYFSLKEYKNVWTELCSICVMHNIAKQKIQNPFERINNHIIKLPETVIVDYLSKQSGIDNSIVKEILDYITYDQSIKNVDIIYQPIIKTGDFLWITPTLLLGSNPERNLISLVNKRDDRQYQKETEDLEVTLVTELDEQVKKANPKAITIKHRNVSDISDIDFAVLDTSTGIVLLCEVKWFTPTDSSKETFARIADVDHGCNQIEGIMGYILKDKKKFLHDYFGYEDDADVIGCVVTKNNIRSTNKYVSVIDYDKISNLISKFGVSSAALKIRNHDYEDRLPENWELGNAEVHYSGFNFKIPAIIVTNETDLLLDEEFT